MVWAMSRKTSKPLMLFAGLPEVLRLLRGRRGVPEVARGTGLAPEHLYLLEVRPARRYGGRIRPARAAKTPRLDTLDVLLRYYGVSLSKLEQLLQEAQEAGAGPENSENP
jgi:hypothetical protein